MLVNITFSAEEELVKKAREKASVEKTSLNVAFRNWLKQYVERGNVAEEIDLIMESMSYATAGKKFSRDELNER